MNPTQTKDQKPPASENVQSSDASQKNTSSSQATEQAKKGEPLPADRPRDRSPKQENL